MTETQEYIGTERFLRGIQTPLAQKFGSVVTAMITPMYAGGATVESMRAEGFGPRAAELLQPSREVDDDSVVSLIDYLGRMGTTGLVVAGTTGSSAHLTHPEHRRLFETVRANTELPIMAGTGSNDPTEMYKLTQHVATHELADAILGVSPYYIKPDQEEIYTYYRLMAEAAGDLPLVAYNIPSRVGGEGIEYETMLRMIRDIPTLRGLKDATGSTDMAVRLRTNPEVPDEFTIFSGDDSLNPQFALEAGAAGAISVQSHWQSPRMSAMYEALRAGNLAGVWQLHAELEPSYIYESTYRSRNPGPATIMMHRLGVIATDSRRLPSIDQSGIEATREEAQSIIEQSGLELAA